MRNPSAERDPTTTAREAIEIVCSGNVERLEEYYSPEFVDHVNATVYRGYDGLLKSYAFYQSIFDKWHFEVEEQMREGNRVASRWVLRGSRRGRAVELRGLTISYVDEKGQVREDWGHADTFSLLGQLGVLRTAILALEVLVGRVKMPKPAS